MSYKDWLATRKPSSRAQARQAALANQDHTFAPVMAEEGIEAVCTRCGASWSMRGGYVTRSCPGAPPTEQQQVELKLHMIDYLDGRWIRLDDVPPF